VEFVRQPDPHIGYLAFDWLTMGQVLSVPMVLFGVTIFFLPLKSGPGPAKEINDRQH
jgi:phosphatidylglycerol:prolipoprotein diacylglycerol transferase